MNSKGSRVILILVVSLTAFTSAMKELNEIRQFGLEVNQFVAEWSDKLAPAEIPAPVLAKVETCQSKQSIPVVELPWLNHVARADYTADIAQPRSKVETVKVKTARRHVVDPVQFEVRFMNDHDGDQDVPAINDFPVPSSYFKVRTHKFNFKLNPRDREILKTLNRSINLRSAS